jgi:hypothetical protein
MCLTVTYKGSLILAIDRGRISGLTRGLGLIGREA